MLTASTVTSNSISGGGRRSKSARTPDAATCPGRVSHTAIPAAADRGAFVVTADRDALTSGALHSGSGETPTYTYELTGNTADLASHVGKQVQVRGRLDDDRKDEVKVDKEEETKLPETQSGKDTVTPAIETDTEMNINVRRLQVSSVTETGRACPSSGQ